MASHTPSGDGGSGSQGRETWLAAMAAAGRAAQSGARGDAVLRPRARVARARSPPRSGARRSRARGELAVRSRPDRARGEAGGAREVAAELEAEAPAVVSVLGGDAARSARARRSRRVPVAADDAEPARRGPARGHLPPAAVEPDDGRARSAAARACSASSGTVVELDEDEIDAAMAVMSCSPAYLALVAEALAEAGERGGTRARARLRARRRDARGHRRAAAAATR